MSEEVNNGDREANVVIDVSAEGVKEVEPLELCDSSIEGEFVNVSIPDAVNDTPGELVGDANALSEALELSDRETVPVDERKLLFVVLTEARGDLLSRILGEVA